MLRPSTLSRIGARGSSGSGRMSVAILRPTIFSIMSSIVISSAGLVEIHRPSRMTVMVFETRLISFMRCEM